MADFCKQCSIELFGRDSGDLAGLSKVKLTQQEIQDGWGWQALCEHCGPTIVDDMGRCIGECELGHKEQLNDKTNTNADSRWNGSRSKCGNRQDDPY